MKTKTIKKKTQTVDAPMTRNEFKVAISKLTRNELIGILCDIYYSQAHDNANDNAKGGCKSECDCGCGSGSESLKTPAKAKTKKSVKSSKVSSISKSKKK